MKEYNDKVYNTRGQDGKVKTGLRNFSTNPMKKGFGTSNHGHLFSEYPYQGTPYDFPRELETVRLGVNSEIKSRAQSRNSPAIRRHLHHQGSVYP